MIEYALIKDDYIHNIILSGRPLAELRKTYRQFGYHVLPIDKVPSRMLQEYDFYDERP